MACINIKIQANAHSQHSLKSPRKQGGIDFCKTAVELMLTVSFFREVNGITEWQEDFELPYTGKASICLANKLLFELVTQHNTSTGIQNDGIYIHLSQSGSILELLCIRLCRAVYLQLMLSLPGKAMLALFA